MRFDYWFSRRLRFGRSAKASTSTGVVIAVAGVALALMVMELILAVVAGFKHEIERKVVGFDAAITVLPPYDYNEGAVDSEMIFTDSLAKALKEIVPEARPVESLRRHAILKTDSDFIAIECVAFGEGHDASFEKGNITRGAYANRGDSIIISETMARQLGIDTCARPFLYFFVNGQAKARRATVAGIYNSNFGEYDKSIVYAPMLLLQSVGDNRRAVSAVALEEIETQNTDEIKSRSQELQQELIERYRTGQLDAVYPVTNVAERGALFFSWLDLLDTNVVVIFILMVCVAAFTLISSLFIIILDRVATIGLLRSLGASRSTVSGIFVNVAMRIVGLGMLIGNVVAIGIILLQQSTHIMPLNPEMYYLDSVPVELSWTAVVALNAGVAIGAWLILILPARLAARIDPATTMRYE